MEEKSVQCPENLSKKWITKRGKKALASLIVSFLTGWLLIGTQNTFSTAHISAFLGALLSFLLFQILQHYLKQFLDKNLNFDELSYIRQAFMIVAKDLFFFIFCPFWMFFVSVSPDINGGKEIDAWTVTLILTNPLYWIFFCGLFIFSCRTKKLKERLMHLQASFKGGDSSVTPPQV